MELPDDDGSVEVGKAVEPVDPRGESDPRSAAIRRMVVPETERLAAALLTCGRTAAATRPAHSAAARPTEAARLVAGPGMWICAACVGITVEVLDLRVEY